MAVTDKEIEEQRKRVSKLRTELDKTVTDRTAAEAASANEITMARLKEEAAALEAQLEFERRVAAATKGKRASVLVESADEPKDPNADSGNGRK